MFRNALHVSPLLRATFVLLVLELLWISATYSQGRVSISGVVLNGNTDLPIPNVNIVVRGTTFGTASDSTGVFNFTMPTGGSCMITFSHIAFEKLTRNLNIGSTKEIVLRIRLKPASFQLPEVVVTGTSSDMQRAYAILDGSEFEKLGEDRLERALRYFLLDKIKPLYIRLKYPRYDFTLYIDDVWYESAYLDDVSPYAIRRVAVWTGRFLPFGYPLHRGGMVVAIWTKDAK